MAQANSNQPKKPGDQSVNHIQDNSTKGKTLGAQHASHGDAGKDRKSEKSSGKSGKK